MATKNNSEIINERSPTKPLTTYAKCNELGEQEILPLSSDEFCVVVLRLATVYGLSPRMRFDLVLNAMTESAYRNSKLNLMRDGTQWRPLVHVADVANAMLMMLYQRTGQINGEIFNVGSKSNVYQISDLAKRVVDNLPGDVAIEWYGDPDKRSYRVDFSKIEKIGFTPDHQVDDGVVEICDAIKNLGLKKTPETITLDWYRHLETKEIAQENIDRYGGMLKLTGVSQVQ